jgi:hypothetical protein
MVIKTENMMIDIDAIDVVVKVKDVISVGMKGLGIELTDEDGKAVWDAYNWHRSTVMYDKNLKRIKGGN